MNAKKRQRKTTGLKRNTRQRLDDDGKPVVIQERVEKLAAMSIFREEHAAKLRDMFYDRSVRLSEIAVLGSYHISSS